jgi:uncharacterized membrane protein YtjA (UPF0391 family)
MLRRAFWFAVLALLAAVLGWSGWLGTKPSSWALHVFCVALGGVLLSLLFSLFEELPATESVQPLHSLQTDDESD